MNPSTITFLSGPEQRVTVSRSVVLDLFHDDESLCARMVLDNRSSGEEFVAAHWFIANPVIHDVPRCESGPYTQPIALRSSRNAPFALAMNGPH